MKKFAFLLLLSTASAAQAQTITFTTEDYPPYNFRKGSEYTGASYDQLLLMMKTVNAEYTVEMMPWARALSLAETEPMHCVFTTAHIPERDKRFKWVEPLAIDRNVMIAKAGSGVKAANIDEAKKYIVGTQRNDYTQDILQRNGFPKIDLATDLNLTYKKLMSGRIDLMPMSEKYYYELRDQGNPLEGQFILSQQTFSIACNSEFPADLLASMQAALDGLIADGTQARILKQYGLGQDK